MAHLYHNENIMKRFFIVSFLIVTVIGILGILSIVLLSVKHQKKEIAMRKVLGASTSEIISTFSLSYIKYTTVGIIVASIVSYFYVNSWLKDFAYKIPVQVSLFFYIGLTALFFVISVFVFNDIIIQQGKPSKYFKK
jgi:ABC-type antimicrobial peptide transport system permease subunit